MLVVHTTSTHIVYITFSKVQKCTFTTYNRHKLMHTKGIIMSLWLYLDVQSEKTQEGQIPVLKFFTRQKMLKKIKKQHVLFARYITAYKNVL